MSRVWRFLPLLFVLLALKVSAQDVKSWLDRMNDAVENLNYEGTFVHVLDGDAETLHIVHRNAGGSIGEKISSLDGAGREIVRRDQEVQCVLPDQRIVLMEAPRGPSSPLGSALPNYSELLEEYYDFVTVQKGQVARRDTQIISIKPRDDYRYGYALWLDRETAMPLKAQVRDETGAVVEQILFTAFEVVDSIPESSLLPTIDTTGFTWIRPHDVEPGDSANPDVAWRASSLPQGFQLSVARQSSIGGAEHPVDHLVYSDGLATVSVFVADPQTDLVEGFSRFGSTNAYSLTVSGRKVTAMGEVPRQTVQRIATSLGAK